MGTACPHARQAVKASNERCAELQTKGQHLTASRLNNTSHPPAAASQPRQPCVLKPTLQRPWQPTYYFQLAQLIHDRSWTATFCRHAISGWQCRKAARQPAPSGQGTSIGQPPSLTFRHKPPAYRQHTRAHRCLSVTAHTRIALPFQATGVGRFGGDSRAQAMTMSHILFRDCERPTIGGNTKATRGQETRRPLSGIPFTREPSRPLILTSMTCRGAKRVT